MISFAEYYNHINCVMPYSVIRYLQRLNVEIINLTQKKIRNPELITSKKFQNIARIINFLHLSSLIYHISPDLTIIAIKK